MGFTGCVWVLQVENERSLSRGGYNLTNDIEAGQMEVYLIVLSLGQRYETRGD